MRRILYIFIIFHFVSSSLYAQTQKVKNQPYGDQKLYHFGITVGMNFQDIILTNNGNLADDGKVWYATIPNYSPGFTVGLSADLWLNRFMNLRFTPTLNFGEKEFEFINDSSEPHFKTQVRSNYINLPLDIKFRTLRLNNYRPYFIAGAYAAIDMSRNKDQPMLLSPLDYGFTIGIGCDFYLPIIKIAPEIRFSFGLKDIIEHERTDITDNSIRKYHQAISKGTSRMISLVFNFE